ncbi:MAG: hypothetical protein N3A69_14795, partial [Leptospiraceae bacterium]|nr:hypothetical protein [Leptospiraceae bacterium]
SKRDPVQRNFITLKNSVQKVWLTSRNSRVISKFRSGFSIGLEVTLQVGEVMRYVLCLDKKNPP